MAYCLLLKLLLKYKVFSQIIGTNYHYFLKSFHCQKGVFYWEKSALCQWHVWAINNIFVNFYLGVSVYIYIYIYMCVLVVMYLYSYKYEWTTCTWRVFLWIGITVDVEEKEVDKIISVVVPTVQVRANRMGNTMRCLCNNCGTMPTAVEYLCCVETKNVVYNKVVKTSNKCITSSSIKKICLDVL